MVFKKLQTQIAVLRSKLCAADPLKRDCKRKIMGADVTRVRYIAINGSRAAMHSSISLSIQDVRPPLRSHLVTIYNFLFLLAIAKGSGI